MDIDFAEPAATMGLARHQPTGQSPFNDRQRQIIDNALPFLLQEVTATHEQRRLILLLLYHIDMSKDQLDNWLKKHPEIKRKAGVKSLKRGHQSWPNYVNAELPSASAVVPELPLAAHGKQVSLLLHIDTYVRKHLDVSNDAQRATASIQWIPAPIQWEDCDIANATAGWKSLVSRCHFIRDTIPRKDEFLNKGLPDPRSAKFHRRALYLTLEQAISTTEHLLLPTLTRTQRRPKREWTEEEKQKLRKKNARRRRERYEELRNLIDALLTLEVFPSVKQAVAQPCPHFLSSIWSMCRELQMADDHILMETVHWQKQYYFVRVFIGVLRHALYHSIQAPSQRIGAENQQERKCAGRKVREKQALLDIFTCLASVQDEELITTIRLASLCTVQALSSRINHEDPFIVDTWNEHSRSWDEQAYLSRNVPLDPLMSYPEKAPTECILFIMCTRLSTLLLKDRYHQDAFPLAWDLWDKATTFQYHDSDGNDEEAHVLWNVKTWAMTEAALALSRLSSVVEPPTESPNRPCQHAPSASASSERPLPFRGRTRTTFVKGKGFFHFNLDEAEATISKVIYTALHMQKGSSPVCQIVAATLMRKAAGLLKLLPKAAKQAGLKEKVRIHEDSWAFSRRAAEICRAVGKHGRPDVTTTDVEDEAG